MIENGYPSSHTKRSINATHCVMALTLPESRAERAGRTSIAPWADLALVTWPHLHILRQRDEQKSSSNDWGVPRLTPQAVFTKRYRDPLSCPQSPRMVPIYDPLPGSQRLIRSLRESRLISALSCDILRIIMGKPPPE